jgi:hypothetical protein
MEFASTYFLLFLTQIENPIARKGTLCFNLKLANQTNIDESKPQHQG